MILENLFDRAEVGVEAVVPRLRDPAMNPRTTIEKIVLRAGVQPWPPRATSFSQLALIGRGGAGILPARTGWKPVPTRLQATRMQLPCWPRLFHNVWACCATDWVERFPSHAVASWLGHSPLIAATHDLQTRAAHFKAAAGNSERAAPRLAPLEIRPPNRQ